MSFISLLKKANQDAPDGIKRIASPFIHGQLINDSRFQAQYQALLNLYSLSDDEINGIQVRLLKETLERAYSSIPFYRKSFNEAGFNPATVSSLDDLKHLPLLTKEQVRASFGELSNPDVSDYYEATTGGSTGHALRMQLSRSSIYRERAFICHYLSLFGYSYRKSRMATFRGISSRKGFSKLNPLYNEIQLSPFLLSKATVAKYADAIDSFKAEFIQGYPSAIANFCVLALQMDVKLKSSIKTVLLISENLLPWQKDAIEAFFQCPIAMFYGHTERSIFAERSVNYDEGYVFQPLYGVVELVEHNTGNIVCTGFINDRMPLIRYALDDEAISLGGNHYEIRGHRTGEALLGCNGERVTQTSFEGLHFPLLSDIAAYQLIQREQGKAVFCFISDQVFDDAMLRRCEQELRSVCPCLEWMANQVDRFELTSRGKFKPLLVFDQAKGD